MFGDGDDDYKCDDDDDDHGYDSGDDDDDDDDDNDYVGRLRTDGELGEPLSIAIACCQKKL